MKKSFLLLLLLMLLIAPQIGTAQSTELPIRIAYFREFYDGTPTGAYLLENGEERHISSDYEFDSLAELSISWEPNCEVFMFNAREAYTQIIQNELLSFDLRFDRLTQLTFGIPIGTELQWSLIGNRIFYQSQNLNNVGMNISVYYLPSMTTETLFTSESNLHIHGLSPDYNTLVFTVENDGLYIMDIKDNAYEVSELPNFQTVFDADIAPSNTFMAVTALEDQNRLYLLNLTEQEVVASLNSPESSAYNSLAWSPSGQQLAYDLEHEIHVLAVNDNTSANISGDWLNNIQNINVQGWTSDGAYIVFDGTIDEDNLRRDLFAIASDGSDFIRLSTTEIDAEYSTKWYVCF